MIELLGVDSLDILCLLFLLLVVAGDVERNPGPTNTDAGEGQFCLEHNHFLFLAFYLVFIQRRLKDKINVHYFYVHKKRIWKCNLYFI